MENVLQTARMFSAVIAFSLIAYLVLSAIIYAIKKATRKIKRYKIMMDMNDSFFKFHKGKKVVMHCKTEADAEKFCEILELNGFTWADGSSYYYNSRFDEYGENTCYCWNVGCSCSLATAVLLNCEIIEFDSIAIREENK